MNTILVWVLVTTSLGAKEVTYSPYMPDLETCQHLQKSVPYNVNGMIENTRCIQIKVVK